MTTLKRDTILSCFGISILIMFLVAYTKEHVFFGLGTSALWWGLGVYLIKKELFKNKSDEQTESKCV